EDLIAEGDKVAFRVTGHGTHEGEFFGLPATGRRFECRVVFVYTLKNGEIVHERRILDFTGVLLQIGVLKARPA
ncbi:MAG: ester cyclase, partial [Vicinamibacterales bacterium]